MGAGEAVPRISVRARDAHTEQQHPTRWSESGPGLALTALPMLFFLLAPLAALLWRADLAGIGKHLAQPMAQQAIWLSLWTSASATVLTLFLGTPLALFLAKQNTRWGRALDTLIDLPTVLPPAVAGLALLMAFGRRGVVGQVLSVFGVEIAFTSLAVILAQLFVASPFYIRAAISGFRRTDRKLEEAAALDGANPQQVFRYVTAPLARPALLGGVVMTWARALGDFGATILFAGNYPGRTQTMPLAIYIGFELDLAVALSLSILLMATAFAVLLVVKWLLGRAS